MRRLFLQAMILSFLVVFCLSGAAMSANEKKYLTYELFKTLTALCPEVDTANLAGLTPAAQALWSQGQMRIPAETHLFEGDFKQAGKKEIAICITSGGGQHYVVIAEQAGKIWRRTGLIPVAEQSISNWNGRALVVGADGCLAWDGKRYRLERGPLATYCYLYEPTAFNGVAIKITYVGPQNEPYPGLLISSFYKVPALSEFKPHRKTGIHYGNDDLPGMWNLSIAPAELRQFALALSHSSFFGAAEDRNLKDTATSHSISMLDSGSRPNYYEVLLKSPETVALLHAFARQIEVKNADGAALLKEYAKMFGSVPQ